MPNCDPSDIRQRVFSALVIFFLGSALLGKEPSKEKRSPSAISSANVQRVDEYRQLEQKGWEVHWSPDGKVLAVVYWKEPVKIISRSMFADVTMEEIGTEVTHFTFSPVAGTFAFSDGGEVTVVDKSKADKVVVDAGGQQAKISFSPDGAHFVTSCYGRQANMWRTSDGTLVRTFQVGGGKGGLTTRFSPDGKILVVGNRNHTTHLFDVATGETLQVLPKRMSHKFAFSPDGKKLAVPYVDGTIGLWDVASGKLLQTLDSQGTEAFSVCWSPNGQILASGGLNAPIVLWNTKDFSVVRSLPAPERVFFLAFSPDGSLLASAGNTATQIWGLMD